MFDLKLIDIIQTIIVGVFSLMLIFYFYFICNKFFIKDKFNEAEFFKWIQESILSKGSKDTGYSILAIVFVYFFGIVAGDLTEKMTDSARDSERNFILSELNWVSRLQDPGKLRRLTLIKRDSTPTGLGESVFSSMALIKPANKFNHSNFFQTAKFSLPADSPESTSRTFHDSLSTTQLKMIIDSLTARKELEKLINRQVEDSALFNNDSLRNRMKTYLCRGDEFDGFISQIFYAAKNWCYSREHEPLNELKSIQNRIDLARSIVLLTVVSIQLLIIFAMFFVILNWKILFNKTKRLDNRNYLKSVLKVSLGPLVFFLTITLTCRECFKICSLSYNKRAFGYYVSFTANANSISNANQGANLNPVINIVTNAGLPIDKKD